MTDMRIVVNKRPNSCYDCLFSKISIDNDYCKLTGIEFDNEYDEIFHEYVMPKDLCPLIALDELKDFKGGDEEDEEDSDII